MLSARFEKTPENLELIQLANLKTQSLSVELKPEYQELLTKAANLAIQKLAGESKFNDKSVQITIVDDVLKVRRLRPNKIILSAKKDENGEWKSIGVPNIDPLKDLKILDELEKVKVEVVQNIDDNKNLQIVEDVKIDIAVAQVKQSFKHQPRKSRRPSELE